MLAPASLSRLLARDVQMRSARTNFPPGTLPFTINFCFSHENFVRVVYSRTGFIRHKEVLNAQELEYFLLCSCYCTNLNLSSEPCILHRRYLNFEYFNMASTPSLSSETGSTEPKSPQALAITDSPSDDTSDLETGSKEEKHKSKNDVSQVNWENDDDPANPLNWGPFPKWKNLGVISIMSLATYVPTSPLVLLRPIR